ncbi:hypothetical protein BJAS_P2353 [Bathymodiolus japonicus methanotrophic gill symbiont]|uniref:coiled-coil domain-containing protein n=1 Tax=Bathymodiolus japonicus methanotrophic gill symbiont TaxID=113269 RepID=UPI001B4FC53D|nr:coiled-coil domain-containing protein [Bathymodiolus japonicus methanotrophic gill symbiont]GFO72263.1 hypothetical protein BJAS_P2353 [Bathymodiolus japonicus methanotrophic gill symbiont]
MSALAFDTYSFVQRLHNVGFSEDQAVVVIESQQEAVKATLEQVHNTELAKKRDLDALELAFRSDAQKLEASLKANLQETELALRSDTQKLEVTLKADLREAELKLELKIAETNTKIAETKAELIRWIVGAGFLQTALITALLLKMSSGL